MSESEEVSSDVDGASCPSRCSTFRVIGVAMVPVNVGMLVFAKDEDEAKAIAEREFQKSNKREQFIINGSEDESSVWAFKAHSAEMNT